MTTAEYLETIKTLLLTNPLVNSFEIIRERVTSNDGYLRVKMVLVNAYLMEFAEYVQNREGAIHIVTYSYHCADFEHNLVVRWDNTPHFPDLEGFPHHKHSGSPETVEPSLPMNIFKVIDEIEQLIIC